MGSSEAPVPGCCVQKTSNMSTVTNLVAAYFHLASLFRAPHSLLGAKILHICLLSFHYLTVPSSINSDFAATNLVTVLIFAIFCTELLNEPPLKPYN